MLNIINYHMKRKIRKRHDWSKYNSIEEIQEFINSNEIKSKNDLNFKFRGLASKILRLGFKVSDFKFENNPKEKWTFLKTKEDIEKYLMDNNINEYSDINSGLKSLIGRLGYNLKDFKKFYNKKYWYKNFNTIKEIQNYINKNNIKKYSDLRNPLKLRISELGYSRHDFTFKVSNAKDWTMYNTIEDFKLFVENHKELTSITDYKQKYPGFVKRLYLLYKLTPSDLGVNSRKSDWSSYNTLEDIQELINNNKIKSKSEFKKSFGGLVNRMRNKLGIKLKDLSFPTKVSSILERKITDFLLQNNINFIDQYRFDDFKKYPFDFYFPEFNLVLEPGGDQHFIPINRWGGEDELKKIKERDKRKYNYCIQNGITILYYFEFSRKKIYSILSENGYMGEWFIDFNLFTNRILEIMEGRI